MYFTLKVLTKHIRLKTKVQQNRSLVRGTEHLLSIQLNEAFELAVLIFVMFLYMACLDTHLFHFHKKI